MTSEELEVLKQILAKLEEVKKAIENLEFAMKQVVNP